MKFKVGDLLGDKSDKIPNRLVYKIDEINQLYFIKYKNSRNEWTEHLSARHAKSLDARLIRMNHHRSRLGKILYK